MSYPQISSPMREGIHPLGSLILPVNYREPLAMHAHLRFTRGPVTTLLTEWHPSLCCSSFSSLPIFTRAMHVVLMTRELEASGHHSRFPPSPPTLKFLVSLLQKKKTLCLLEKTLGSNLRKKLSVFFCWYFADRASQYIYLNINP